MLVKAVDNTIVLNSLDLSRSTDVGKQRHNNSKNGGFFLELIGSSPPLLTDIEGARAERAFAKCIGREDLWPTVDSFKKFPDIGDFEVRHTPDHGNRLIIRRENKKRNIKQDNENRYYALVTGSNGTYRIHGYILGKDGMKDKNLDDPGKKGCVAWFVKQKDLIPLQRGVTPNLQVKVAV